MLQSELFNPFQKQSCSVTNTTLAFRDFQGAGCKTYSNANYCSSELKATVFRWGFEYTDFFSIPVNMAIFLYLYWSVQNDT